MNTLRQTGETTLLTDDSSGMIERMVSEQLSRFLENRRTREEDSERVTEIFDSTQPVDSLTGTPPLKGRVTERSNRRESDDTKNREESVSMDYGSEEFNRNVRITEDSGSMESEESYSDEEMNSDEQRGISASHYLILTLGGVMISVFFSVAPAHRWESCEKSF